MWTQIAKREWSATTEDGDPLRVRSVGLKEDAAFGAYRGGKYLGEEKTLEAAQKRAEKGIAKARPVAAEPVPAKEAIPVPPSFGKPLPAPSPALPGKGAPVAARKGPRSGDTEVPAPGKSQPASTGHGPINPLSRIVVLRQENGAAAGSKRYAQYDLAKRSATAGDFKRAGGKKHELELFVARGWLRLEEDKNAR